MKRSKTILILLSAVALSSCGTAQPDSLPVSSDQGGQAPLDAALVTPGFGWVLTPDKFLTSHDGGATLADVGVPVPAGPARAAHFVDASTGLVASASGDSITIARTKDGGRSWSISTTRDPQANPAGYSSLSVAVGDANQGAIVARTATSQAFSIGTLFATGDGGATWSAHPAPEAGRVSVEPGGRIWVAGSNLAYTTDRGQNWTRAALTLAGPGTIAASSPPLADTLAVTVLNGEHSEVQLLTTTDNGRTWAKPTRLPIPGNVGPGARIPVASTTAGLIVFDSGSGRAYHSSGTDLRSSGLPQGVRSATFAPDGKTGWALAGYGTCTAGKKNCHYQHELVLTHDSGATWRSIAVWKESA